MNKISDLEIMNYLKKKTKKAKDYLIENKWQVAEVFIGSALVGTTIFFGRKNIQKKRLIDNQSKEIEKAIDFIKEQTEVIGLQSDVILKQRNKIDALVDLCKLKDKHYDSLMSDALRHGSSLAGREMAYKQSLMN